MMSRRIGSVVLLFLGWGRIAAQDRPQPAAEQLTESRISVSVNLVKVPLSVFDDKGRMIQDLHLRDFRLYENGIAQDISSFGRDGNPVSVVLLIDTSGSVEKELKKIREAALNFARALSPEDRICVLAFADEVMLVQGWTNDQKQLRKALGRLEPGYRTALYDAMFRAADRELRGIDGRKAIILLTDTLNNQSVVGFRDAAVSIVQSQASLYVVSKTVMARKAASKQRRVVMLSEIYRKQFGDRDYIDEFFRKRENEMAELAEDTGGRAFFPRDYDEIPTMYQEVARELKSKFFLT